MPALHRGADLRQTFAGRTVALALGVVTALPMLLLAVALEQRVAPA